MADAKKPISIHKYIRAFERAEDPVYVRAYRRRGGLHTDDAQIALDSYLVGHYLYAMFQGGHGAYCVRYDTRLSHRDQMTYKQLYNAYPF